MRLILLEPTEAFVKPFLAWRADPVARRFNPLKPLDESQAARRLLAARTAPRDLDETGECRRFVSFGGTVVGTVALANLNRMMRTAELSYHMAPEFQRRGLGTAAVCAFVSQIFADSDLRRLTAFVHEHNLPSRRLLERVGFTCEGMLREHFLIEGVAANEAFYGLLRSEWAPRQGSSPPSLPVDRDPLRAF